MVWRETLINTQKINTQNLSFILTHRCYYCLNANRNDLLSFDFLCGFISLSEKSNKKLYGKKICCKTFSLRRNLEYENIYNFILMLLRMLLAFRSKDEIERDRSRKIHQIVLLSFDMKSHAGKTTWITISNHHFIWFSLFQF